MKKILVLFTCMALMIFCGFSQETLSKSENINLDFKIYLPSLVGHVTGDNPLLGLREDTDSVDSCTNFLIETRCSIASLNKVTFSWSFGMGAYIENNKIQDSNLMSMNLSLGAGIYWHPFDSPTFPLNGLCVYLYPVYQVPVYTQGYESYLKWKSAVDVGYNFAILNSITVYPYMRYIIGWNSSDYRYGFDCGIAVGFYFH